MPTTQPYPALLLRRAHVAGFALGLAVLASIGGPFVTAQDRPDAVQLHPQVRLVAPLPGAAVASPISVSGLARGTWYFEASFAVRLYGEDDRELAVAVAQAQEPWMTEDFVPFTAELEFEARPGERLTLVLEKANPSGLVELDDEVSVPLRSAGEK